MMRQRGFTLIEVLVVLFIISIVTAVALLSIGRNEKKQLDHFADELTRVILFAEEQAKLQPTVLGLNLTDNSYQFLTLQSGLRKNKWLPVRDQLLGRHAIPSRVIVDVLTSADEPNNQLPQIIITSNGDMTPFDIDIGTEGHAPRVRLHGERDGTISKIAL